MAQSLSAETSRREHPIEIALLGPFRVERSGSRVDLPGRRHEQLLVNLALHPGRRIATEVLVDRLWGESPPPSATKTVQKYVSELRRSLGIGTDGYLATDGAGYVLHVDPLAIDGHRFEHLVASARQLAAEDAVAVLAEALALWRGEAVEGFADDAGLAPWSQRLEELRLATIERRLGLLLELGHHADALPELEQLTLEHPLREELWAHLMSARAAAGRRGDALAAFQQARTHLARELGIEPSSRLRELERRILADAPAGQPPATARSEPRPTLRGGLPHPISAFIGRQPLIAALVGELGDGRLVTLTGAGGSGKTRLAIEVARTMRDHGDGESWFVDLSSVDAPAQVVTTTARALRLPDQPGTDAAVLLHEAIGARRILLVVDNCEHVLDAAGTLVAELLMHCENLRVLATSRAPLGIPGERVRPVPPLELPSGPTPGAAESVQLFVARAREAEPGFGLDQENAAAVMDICTRLDGVPLALELAAAQIPAMSPADMVSLLDDRFRILRAGGGRPARHQTLRAAMDWSYGLLTGPEATLFDRISVFPGSFDLAASTAVGAGDGIEESDVAVLLARLVRQSMLVRADGPAATGRYRLLDTLRAYGRERLADAGGEHDRRAAHARYFAGVAEHAADPYPGDGDAWHRAATLDQHNLRSALSFATAHDPELAAGMVWALSLFWTRTDQVVEGLQYVEPLLAAVLAPEARARVLCCAAELRSEHGEAVIAEQEAAEALSILEGVDEAGSTRARFALGRALANSGRTDEAVSLMERVRDLYAGAGTVRWWKTALTLADVMVTQGRYDEAAELFDEVLRWAERHDLPFEQAKAHWLRGALARDRGRLDEAWVECEEALAAFISIDDRSAVAHVRMTLGDIARLAGDHPTARALYDTAYEALTDIGDRRCTASAMKNLGDLERQDDPDRAARRYLECLDRRRALGDRAGVAEVLERLAATLAGVGQLSPAATLLGQADSIRADTRSVVSEVDRAEIADVRRRVELGLEPAALDRASGAGAGLGLDEMIRLVTTSLES